MYIDVKKGVSTIKCNEKGCTKSFTGKNHGDAWLKAKKAGWNLPNASTAWCNDHKPARAAAKSNKKVTAKAKAAKATGKKAKGTGKLSANGKVWKYTPKPAVTETVTE